VPLDVHRSEAKQLCGRLGDLVVGIRTVCAYLPVGAEPGSPEMVDRLHELCATVLLPVTRTGADDEHLALWWARYIPDDLISARFGLREPARGWLKPSTVARAGVVLVPALAVDHTGVRLGRGGGFYDRSLALCAPGTRLVAVVRDEEVVESLPAEPHDVPMTHALTPGNGLIALSTTRATNSGAGT
jgi:5-formyltetrahydrofolate cyclo-ligase